MKFHVLSTFSTLLPMFSKVEPSLELFMQFLNAIKVDNIDLYFHKNFVMGMKLKILHQVAVTGMKITKVHQSKVDIYMFAHLIDMSTFRLHFERTSAIFINCVTLEWSVMKLPIILIVFLLMIQYCKITIPMDGCQGHGGYAAWKCGDKCL